MPLSRGPSHRALEWVRGHSSKSSSSSNKNSKRNVEPSIVHLGGTRVGGLTYEDLQFPMPGQTTPGGRPITQWNFTNGALPNQPGIGIAVASPDDEPHSNSNGSETAADRPVTQWFAVPPPAGATSGVEDKTSKESLSKQLSHTSSSTEPVEEKMLSPWTPTSSSNLTNSQISQASSLSSLPSPLSSISDLAETSQPSPPPPPSQAPAPFPKRSTSLSQASRHAPLRLSQRAIVPAIEGVPLKAKQVHLRRTQSHAEDQRQVQGRRHEPIQVQPILQEEREVEKEKDTDNAPAPAPAPLPLLTPAVYSDESQIREEREDIDVGRSPPRPQPGSRSPDTQLLPPLTYPPPAGPLPPISGTKLAAHGKMRGQNRGQEQASRHRRDMSYTSNDDASSKEDQMRTRERDGEREREREQERERERERPKEEEKEKQKEVEIGEIGISFLEPCSPKSDTHPHPDEASDPKPETAEISERWRPVQVQIQAQQQQQQQQTTENHNHQTRTHPTHQTYARNQTQTQTQPQPQQEKQAPTTQKPRQRLTPKERFWLHRQYRGEANFLKAWGLDISSAEDREEGLLLLREFIDGETREEFENHRRERHQQQYDNIDNKQQRGSVSRSSTSSNSSNGTGLSSTRDRESPGGGLGLGVIAEECQGRALSSNSAVRVHIARDSSSSLNTSADEDKERGGQGEYWKRQHQYQYQYQHQHQQPRSQTQQGPSVVKSSSNNNSKSRPLLDKHSRAESENSVLGAYLDLRLSQSSSG